LRHGGIPWRLGQQRPHLAPQLWIGPGKRDAILRAALAA
jgi:hypothetical protein